MKPSVRKAADDELDPEQVRFNRVAQILSGAFQLEATGTIFEMGVESNPEFKDIIYVLNRLYTTGYVQQYNLLPFNVEPSILVGTLTKDVVAWLVPVLIQAVDRKALSGSLDILAENNESLVYLCDVLSWYWHKTLGGPKPAISSMVKLADKPTHMVVQNAALVCPMCYHQFVPPATYKTQSAKAWAYARWFPLHLVEYHKWVKPGTKSTNSKKGGTK
jgi:hypothetical protein